MHDPAELRATFNADAERYDRARPGYPAALLDTLGDAAGLSPGARVLEIGCGTGQATVAMAERGWAVRAIELGDALAARARRNLARYDHVIVEVCPFEEADLEPATYDAVVAFTAFHWLDPATRVERAARALRPGGVLATVATIHVQGGDEFFTASQRCYRQWDPDTPPAYRLPRPDEVERDAAELEESRLLDAATFAEFSADVTYTSAEYGDLLLTYSAVLALPPARREGLVRCLAGLIDGEYGGQVVKSYVFQLRMARRSTV